MTKSFLTYSVERIEKNSAPYQASCTLWQDGFQLILPELLKFLRLVVRDWDLLTFMNTNSNPATPMHPITRPTGASSR